MRQNEGKYFIANSDQQNQQHGGQTGIWEIKEKATKNHDVLKQNCSSAGNRNDNKNDLDGYKGVEG